ncbi:MAG: DNA repair protein RecO [Oceanihabitans sp.]
MQASTKALVLSTLKYSDSDLIVKCYTQEFGVLSFILKGILKRKKGKIKTAYFQLLAQLQLEIVYKKNRSLHNIADVKLNYQYANLQTNVQKTAVLMFLAETLSNALQEEEKNEFLFSYIETTMQWLDQQNQYANFHLLFLLKITKFLGFYPETKNMQFSYFNLQSGNFENLSNTIYSVSGQNLTLLKQLLGINFDALSTIKINAKQRHSFLSMLLLYFELHLGSFKKPKSLEVFTQVFNT